MHSLRQSACLILKLAIVARLVSATAALSANYDDSKAVALRRCQAIDPAAYQSGLFFNPDGYRSYYARWECLQKTAVQFRDETLFAHVRQRHSLFSSSWGYSEARCTELVRRGVADDEKILAEIKQRYQRGTVRLRDFRLEKNGNGRDFDIIPSFAGDYAHGYVFSIELLRPGGGNAAVLLHSSGYYVDGNSNLRIFLRQEDIRKLAPAFAPDQPYTMRATLILDIGNGGQSGMWSETFIERVFPIRERSQTLTREVRF